jgi:hypothetical protein
MDGVFGYQLRKYVTKVNEEKINFLPTSSTYQLLRKNVFHIEGFHFALTTVPFARSPVTIETIRISK